MNKNGRPEYKNEQYEKWLEDLKPFLKIGYTLYSAIEKAHLVSHKDSIYRKYKLNDWFCEKIDAYRQYSAEIVNSIFSRLIVRVDEKIRNGEDISEVE